MTEMLAALMLIGVPASVLFAVRCAIQRQNHRDRTGYPDRY